MSLYVIALKKKKKKKNNVKMIHVTKINQQIYSSYEIISGIQIVVESSYTRLTLSYFE